MECDPANTPDYLNSLEALGQLNIPGAKELEQKVTMERSRGLWSSNDVLNASKMLGFGEDEEASLRIAWDEDVELEFLIKAWKAARQSVERGTAKWRYQFNLASDKEPPESEKAILLRKDLKDALKILCQVKGTKQAMDAYEESVRLNDMTVDDAYQALGANKEFDDTLMLTIFNLRVSGQRLRQDCENLFDELPIQVMDQPATLAKLTDALKIITEDRNSSRLRTFLDTGADGSFSSFPTYGVRISNKFH